MEMVLWGSALLISKPIVGIMVYNVRIRYDKQFDPPKIRRPFPPVYLYLRCQNKNISLYYQRNTIGITVVGKII